MEHTRRALLSGVAAGGALGLAGCAGGNGGGSDGGNTLDTGEYGCDLSEPSDPDLEYRPTLGDPEADVVVRAFEDFTCGHCATYKLEHFPAVREEFIVTDEIRYEHWDFPIPVNETWAVPVASAARGVGDRAGDEAFFEFATAAYESQGEYDGPALGAAAEAAGADPCAAIADAQFSAYEEASMGDRDEGESMGVSGTPTIFVNGEATDGYDAETVIAAIESAL
ncbi:DsbA family protein [Halorubrum cibi]|uniref:Protein-disulfide isomerase n=1 Tax=Halorubrum cibi TaxID=413815 RepID=A0A521C2F7_9EURY|nr:thioredoxin domain-containing protein [Halorubrum cibi]SMO53578.1 Protein-disulfide isomerase [Halorubrum cibi]